MAIRPDFVQLALEVTNARNWHRLSIEDHPSRTLSAGLYAWIAGVYGLPYEVADRSTQRSGAPCQPLIASFVD